MKIQRVFKKQRPFSGLFIISRCCHFIIFWGGVSWYMLFFVLLGKLFSHWNCAASCEDKTEPAKLGKELDLPLAWVTKGKAVNRYLDRGSSALLTEANHHHLSGFSGTHIAIVWVVDLSVSQVHIAAWPCCFKNIFLWDFWESVFFFTADL